MKRFAHFASNNAPLGIMVASVLFLVIGVVDNFIGPVVAGDAHFGVK